MGCPTRKQSRPKPLKAESQLSELRALCSFLEQTGVSPLVDSEHALADARDAFARLESGDVFGKVVVVP